MNAPVTAPQPSPTPPSEPGAAGAALGKKPLQRRCSAGGSGRCPARSHDWHRAHRLPPAPAPSCSTCQWMCATCRWPCWRLFASVALLHWASAVFIPIMLSLLLTTALRPWWMMLYRYHVPRWLSAGAPLISLVLGLASAAWSLSDGATNWWTRCPWPPRKCATTSRRARRQQPAGHRAEGGHPDRAGRRREQHHQPTPARCAAGGGGAPAVQCARLPVERHHGVDVCARPTHGGGVSHVFALASATCFATSCCALQAPAWSAARSPSMCWKTLPTRFSAICWCRSSRVCWWAWPQAWPIGPWGWKTRPYGVWWRGAQPGAVHWLCAGHRGIGTGPSLQFGLFDMAPGHWWYRS